MRTKLFLAVGCVVAASIALCGCGGQRAVQDLSRTMQRAGEAERKATCLSNLKQLALAALMFAQDHNETLPNANTWADDLQPYCSSSDLLRCPSDTHEFSYAMNSQLSGKKLGDIADPTKTVIFFESSAGVNNASDPMTSVCKPPRHGNGNNFAYVDGHVKSVEQPRP
jgi:prepilin-type processing-associated H-X9-DG protein